MSDKIKIKCPVCGVVLGALDNPANTEKFVICPNCKQKNKFKDFKRIPPTSAEEPSDETQVVLNREASPGYLLDMVTGKRYPLRVGRLLVGRRPLKSAPKADIPIETTDQGMSREHMFIEVMSGRDGHYHVYVSNAKNQNPTMVNGDRLEGSNKEGIRHGDIVKLCDTPLKYICDHPFDDKTEI